METLPRAGLRREDMLKRVAYFKNLKGYDGGLPDSDHASAVRTLYNVIGFQPPKGEGGAVSSPVGEDAARMAAIKISEGFNLGYCRAKPGKGPMMHNHDTNETFIPMTGTWRCSVDQRKGRGRLRRCRALRRSLLPARLRAPLRERDQGRSQRGIDPDVRDRRRRPARGIYRRVDERARGCGRLAEALEHRAKDRSRLGPSCGLQGGPIADSECRLATPVHLGLPRHELSQHLAPMGA